MSRVSKGPAKEVTENNTHHFIKYGERILFGNIEKIYVHEDHLFFKPRETTLHNICDFKIFYQ